MMIRRTPSHLGLGLVAALSLASGEALATTCSFSSVSAPAFGGYDVFAAFPVPTTGSITYACTGGTAISIALSKGAAASYFPRHMTSGGWSLLYNLFTDASHSTIWGDGTGGTALYTSAAPPSGTNVTVTIYGLIPARQNVGVGTYGDTIVATINF